MNTNAKKIGPLIGLLMLLSVGVIGSPVMAQSSSPAEITNKAEAKKQATEYLRRARLAMKGGNLQLADRYIAEAEKVGSNATGFLGRFTDSPAKARKDLERLKLTAQGQGMIPAQLSTDQTKGQVVQLAAPNQSTIQARSMMAQAKAAFDRGDLNLSEKFVQQAGSLKVAESAFAGGHTPWELGLLIQKQRRLVANMQPGNMPTGNVRQASANQQPGGGQVVPAQFQAPLDGTIVQPATGDALPAMQRVAQQLPGLNPLMQQPAPVTLQTQALPGTGISLPGGAAASISDLAPATAAPATTSPAPPATTTLPVQPQLEAVPNYAAPQATAYPQPATGTQSSGVPSTGFTQPLPTDPGATYGNETAAPAGVGTYTSPETGISSGPNNFGVSANELIKLGEQKVRDGDLEEAQDFFRQAWQMRDSLDAQTRQRVQEHLQMNSVELNAEGKEASAEEREEAARLNRMMADIQREQMSINREMDTNPKVAWEKMQQLQQRLNDADLPDATRRRWVAKLQKNSAEMERYIETNRAQIELDEKNRDVLDLVDRERRMRVDVQNQLAKTLEEFNTLMDQQRFSEAYVLARQSREIAPNHEVTESMIWKSRFAERMYVEMNLRDRRDRMLANSLDMSEIETPDAYTLHNPIKFPKRWDELTGKRQALLAGETSRYSESEQAIERALRKKVSVQFDEAPIGEVIQSLGKMTGVNVFIDVEGLAEEGVTTDTPVTMNLSEEISLRSVLNLLLGQFRLGYVIQDEVLRITSETARQGDVYPKTYYVGDLVIPIPNFMPGNTNGLAAALQQAYAVLGYGPGMNQGRMQNAPLVVADDSGQGQQNVGSPLALAQMNSSTPLPGMGSMPQQPSGALGGASGADFDSLTNLITTTVEPDSWDDVGGPGTVQPFDSNLSIVVSNTQEVHDQIVDLLEQLRRLQDLQVTIEVRFITLQDNFFERIGVDFDFGINDNSGLTNAQLNADDFDEDGGQNIIIGLDPTGAPTVDLDLKFDQNHFASALPQFGGFDAGAASRFGFAILSDIETFFLLEAIQGDSRTNIMQAPKVTLFNGQIAFITDTQNRPFVTSVIPVVGDFAVAQQPVIMVLAEGTQLSVQAVVSSDRRFVRLTMMPMFSQIGDVDTFTFEGRRSSTTGSSTETDPDNASTTTNQNDELFTEGTTVQLPNFATTSVNTVVSVPDGGTVLMGGIKRLAEGRTERGMPILSKLPYINRLFKNVGTGRETQTLMMMVTPRIIIQEEEEERVLGTPVP